VANVMKGCIERTHLLISVKNTYLYVLFNEDQFGI
jgi:hypothetical protein